MSNEQDNLRPASLGRALSRGFRATYDHLGYVVFTTFCAFILTVALAAATLKLASKAGILELGSLDFASAALPGLAGILLFLPAMLAAWLAAVGVFYYANKSVYNEYPTPVDTWTGVRTLFWPAIQLFALDFAVTVLLLGDTVFLLAARRSSIFQILGIVCGYLTLVWAMMLMYHLPLLVAQLGMQSGPRPLVIVRKSFLLVADNPGFTVGLFLAIIALAVVCAVLGFVGMAVFCLGATAFVLTHALRELFIRYGIVEDEPEVIEDRGWPRES